MTSGVNCLKEDIPCFAMLNLECSENKFPIKKWLTVQQFKSKHMCTNLFILFLNQDYTEKDE